MKGSRVPGAARETPGGPAAADQRKPGAVLSFAVMALTTASALVYTPFMLRQLGQSEYGLYMLIGSFAGYLALLDFGLHNTIYRFVAGYRARGETREQESFLAVCFSIYGLVGLAALAIGAGLLFRLEAIFGHGLDADEMGRARVLFSLLVLNVAISMPLEAFQYIARGYGRFVFAYGLMLGRILLRTGAVITVLLLGYRSVALVVTDTLFNLAAGLLGLVYCFRVLGVRARFHGRGRRLAGEMLGYAAFTFILAVVHQLLWRTGQVVLGIVADTAAVAVYAVAVNLAVYYQVLAGSVSGVFMPRVSALVAAGAGGRQLTDLLVRVGRLQLLLTGFILAGFALLGRQFIALWAGPGYQEVFAITLLFFSCLLVPLTQTVGVVILQVQNRIGFQAAAGLAAATLNVVLAAWLGRRLGAPGAALAAAASVLLGQGLALNIYFRRRIGLEIGRFFRQAAAGLVPAILLSLLLGALVLPRLPGRDWPGLVIRAAVFTVIYAALAWTAGLNRTEKALLRRRAAVAAGRP